jgi:hypothetical protein
VPIGPVGVGAVAVGAAAGALAPGTVPLAAGTAGRAGFLPASGAFGSQCLFFSASAASCSAVRCGTLSMKGTGVLVMYSATASASQAHQQADHQAGA